MSLLSSRYKLAAESLRQGYSLPSNSCNISNTRDSVLLGYPKREKRVENKTCSGIFLTKVEMFGQPMKHCLECLMYFLNRSKN